MSTHPRLAAVAVALGVTATLASAPAASAHQQDHDSHGKHGEHRHHGHHGKHHGHHHASIPSQHVLADGLVSPLRAAVADDGTVYVSQNFTGTIDRISRSGTTTPVYTDPHGYEVGGLSLSGRSLFFTVTQSADEGENLDSWLKVLTPGGTVRTIADVHDFEAATNPDQHTTYGFADVPASSPCLKDWPAENGPAAYPGAVDSHPYATYALGNGWTYVADAGANAVFLVSPRGRISTVATLPAIPFTLTAQAAAGVGVPDGSCLIGERYYFEPVPTDVEVGGDGTIYVTSLPGGPEGPQLGARGGVFAINAHTAHRISVRMHHGHHGGHQARARQVATGLLGPTGLAVSPRGTLYVAQMFGDTLSKVTLGRHGAQVHEVLATPTPGEVEWTPRGLYFTGDVLSGTPLDPHGNTTTPDGKLIRFG